jgi:hypothetical protein
MARAGLALRAPSAAHHHHHPIAHHAAPRRAHTATHDAPELCHAEAHLVRDVEQPLLHVALEQRVPPRTPHEPAAAAAAAPVCCCAVAALACRLVPELQVVKRALRAWLGVCARGWRQPQHGGARASASGVLGEARDREHDTPVHSTVAIHSAPRRAAPPPPPPGSAQTHSPTSTHRDVQHVPELHVDVLHLHSRQHLRPRVQAHGGRVQAQPGRRSNRRGPPQQRRSWQAHVQRVCGHPSRTQHTQRGAPWRRASRGSW